MTHIDNIPHIISHGVTHFLSKNKNLDYKNIGDGSLINLRNEFLLFNGKTLGEYIPFYFAKRTPMLYVIHKGFNNVPITPQEDIVYLISSVHQMNTLGVDFLFTDGHAVNGLTTVYTKESLPQLDSLLDFAAIEAKSWIDTNDNDKKRKKEAEFLVLGDLSYDAILGFAVYNFNAQKKMETYNLNRKIVIKPEYYF